MFFTTLTTKGQVTIPKKVGKALNLETGDKIEIIITEDREAIFRPVPRKVDDVFKKLYKPGRKAVSIETIDEAIKKRMKDTFR